ncbi:hypothetical protein TRFO_06083 [Tritrichomonas foetus]|uniref:Uncharacterized protein n=1 Tax=Tritrichomonas foetus TaxID=1144522 RepID=A0A1J4K2P8_9EUKA|nr:hypothetical protein TRFO_06083 [Tritrichomonas foetus]|eukprot:OHT05080.1 hypothetical protein TRFO_06083 [Tritrichomonas foetus]
MKTKFLFSNEFKNAIFYELLQFLQENIAFPPILELLRNLEIPLDVSILPLIDRYTNTPPSPGDDFCECYTSLKSIRGQCGQLLVTFLNFLPQMVQNPELIINLWIDLFFQSNNFFLLSVMLDYCQPSQISHLIETLVSTYKQTEQMPRNIPDYLYLYCSFLVTNIYKSNEIPPIILQCIESLKSVQNSVIYRTLLYKVIYSITKFTGVIGEGFPEFMAHEYMKISESDSSCLMIPSNDCLNFFILLTKNQQQINENLGHLILQLASNLMIYIFKLIEIGHPERLNTAFELLNAIFVQFGKRNIEISSTIISNILDFLITEYDDIIQNTENIPILLQLLRTFIMFPLLTNGLTKEFNAEFYKYFMSQLVESPGSIQRMYDDLNTRYINDHKFAFLLLFFKIALDNEYRENIEDLVKTALLIIEKCDISEGKLAKYIMNIFFQYFFDEYVDDFSPYCIKASCTLFSEGELSLHSDSLANIVVLFFHIFEKFTINDAGFITGLFNLSSEVLLQSDEPATTMAGVLIFAGCMKQIGISQFVTNQDYFEKLYDFLQIIQSDKFCPFSITGRNSVEVTIVMQALQAMSVEPAFKQHGIDVSEIINEVLRNEDPVLYTDFAYRTQRISLESIFDL